MDQLLKNITSIQFGLYQKPVEGGDTRFLQVNDFDDTNQIQQENASYINLLAKNKKHELQPGDILFAAKGYRNFAWVCDQRGKSAVASSIFFVLRPDHQKALPEYIATVLNTARYQSIIQALGAGSTIPSIRKEELGAMKIAVPSLAVQHKVVELKRLHQKSIVLTQQILEERNKIYQTAINHLINA